MTEPAAYEHRTSTVDGVPVHHFPDEHGTCDAVLVFAVGGMNETLPTSGILHVIEHLVMGANRDTPIEVNASVSLDTVMFEASGRAAPVGAFLTAICRSLAQPPTERLEVEASVIAAEGGAPCHFLMAALSRLRFGNRGPGLALPEGPGPDGIPAAMIETFAARWFTAGNAVLTIVGELPELSLPLRPGAAPARVPVPRRTFTQSEAVADYFPGAAVSLLVPPTTEGACHELAVDVIAHRVEERVRHLSGHSYVVDTDYVVLDDGWTHVVVFAEAPERKIDEVVSSLLQAVLGFRDEGPTSDEVVAAVEARAERLHGRRAYVDQVLEGAVLALRGVSWVVATEPALRAVAFDEVSQAVRDLVRDAQFAIHEASKATAVRLGVPVTDGLPTHPELPAGREFRPPVWVRAVTPGARRAVLVLHERGLAARLDDAVSVIDWEDVIGVMHVVEDEVHVVFGADGHDIPVGARLYKGGAAVVAEILRRVPAELVFDQSKFIDEGVG
ncbi:MAG TPA: hypothetical protein VIT20_05365 [Propionibacteriaceae bacterium]